MNFYQSSLITLIVFTIIFYIHWSRFDKKINEGVFARFLIYGILMGIIYGALIAYTYISEYYSIFIMIFSSFLLFPVILSGAVLAIISGKYRKVENLPISATAIGGGLSLVQIFFYSMLLTSSTIDLTFDLIISLTTIFVNIVSSYLIGSGIQKGKLLLYYNASIIAQFPLSISIIFDYFYGRFSLLTALPLAFLSAIIYILIIH